MEDTLSITDAAIWLPALAILFLLFVSAFFSGSETALTAANRAKLHGMEGEGSARALHLKEDSERLIGGILLGNNLANILATSLATALFTTLLGENGVAAATLIMTALVLIFAEVLPKTYAIINPERMAAFVVRVTLRIFGVPTDPEAQIMAHEEIAEAITLHASEGTVEKDDRDRLLAALDLKLRTVEEIMIHRRNIEMIDAELPPEQILDTCLRSPHTRIPVFRGEPENIVGVIHAKDLLRAVDKLIRGEGGLSALANFDVMDVVMEPWFVPDATTLDDQMRAFLHRHSHFALVVDEYGALQGLVTLEDILEEIVGDITDETDVEVEGIERFADGTVLVEGTMSIRDLNRATDWSLPDEEANTIAGLVIHEAQTIPTTGQVFSFGGFRIEVVERERNRLHKLRIRPL